MLQNNGKEILIKAQSERIESLQSQLQVERDRVAELNHKLGLFENRLVEAQRELEECQEALDNSCSTVCVAMGVDQERYDTDESYTECYTNCFKDAARVIRMSGIRFDQDEGDFKFNPIANPD